jgi:hypothetical protein
LVCNVIIIPAYFYSPFIFIHHIILRNQMRNKEIKERIRLLEYENQELRFELDEIKKQLKPIRPMFPFPTIEIHSMGCSYRLPGYPELKAKYRSILKEH